MTKEKSTKAVDGIDAGIDAETAGVEFQRWADAMDLDVDVDDLDEEDKAQFLKQKKRICTGIMRRALVINDEGEAEYTPQHRKSKYRSVLVFHERTGASLMAMDGKKKNQNVAKTYAVMADICGVPPGTFAGLVGPDVKMCEALFALLMD